MNESVDSVQLEEGSDEEKIRAEKMKWLRGRMTQNKKRNFQVGDSVKVKKRLGSIAFGGMRIYMVLL